MGVLLTTNLERHLDGTLRKIAIYYMAGMKGIPVK